MKSNCEKNTIRNTDSAKIVPVLVIIALITSVLTTSLPGNAGRLSRLRDKIVKPIKKTVDPSRLARLLPGIGDIVPSGGGGNAPVRASDPLDTDPRCQLQPHRTCNRGVGFSGIAGWDFTFGGGTTVAVSVKETSACNSLLEEEIELPPEPYCKDEKNKWEESKKTVRELMALNAAVTTTSVVYDSGWGYLAAAGSTAALGHNCKILDNRIDGLNDCSANYLKRERGQLGAYERQETSEINELNQKIEEIQVSCADKAEKIVEENQEDKETGALLLIELRKECDARMEELKSQFGG